MFALLMDTILVTGGCGFIGSDTCLELLKKGYRILIIDSNINSKENVIEKIKKIAIVNSKDERIEFIKGDIRDYSLLNETFKKEKKFNNGISAVIQPSGSIRDKEIIKFANATDTVLVFSNTRHFRH